MAHKFRVETKKAKPKVMKLNLYKDVFSSKKGSPYESRPMMTIENTKTSQNHDSAAKTSESRNEEIPKFSLSSHMPNSTNEDLYFFTFHNPKENGESKTIENTDATNTARPCDENNNIIIDN